jgi:inorganic pyrophosphatase
MHLAARVRHSFRTQHSLVLSTPIAKNLSYCNKMKVTLSTVSILALVQPLAAWSSSPLLVHTRSRTASVLHAYSTQTTGEAKTESFRIQFMNEAGTHISPWHDIPLKGPKGGYNMIVEIPKMTKAKMEVATKETNNPIAQDMKKGKLRDYHGPIFWNYGCIPQTWENPKEEHPVLKCFGDNDPIDVVEIGSQALTMGSVTEVKALGVIAMIDDGELDWKVLAISMDDPLAQTYKDIHDVPEAVKAGVREWFRWYKTPDDKPLNAFGFDEKYLDAKEAEKVIHETHEAWKKLKSGDVEKGKLWL